MCENELWQIKWDPFWIQFIPVVWIEESPFSHIHSTDSYGFYSVIQQYLRVWMIEWDLNRFQSIDLEFLILDGANYTDESNLLIMKSMNGKDDWLIRSPFSDSLQSG